MLLSKYSPLTTFSYLFRTSCECLFLSKSMFSSGLLRALLTEELAKLAMLSMLLNGSSECDFLLEEEWNGVL